MFSSGSVFAHSGSILIFCVCSSYFTIPFWARNFEYSISLCASSPVFLVISSIVCQDWSLRNEKIFSALNV